MIKQKINGKSAGTAYAAMTTADFSLLSPLLAGVSELFIKVASGGTVANIATPNFRRFSVGKKNIDGVTISKAFTLPHCKTTVKDDDIRTQTIGLFDVDYNSSVKCEYCNSIGNSSRG
ncbi:MAG: hypothetical protein PHX44_01655 [Sulfurimonas sp.]|uniref:hypothetical protein n=1 Tax=Sulfurimonas sp. TaxID=2022749 RepID=UPI00261F46AB|nr:hypothetical protein [Sulfurimonas sp.]MDD2651723.1 hypothetical protein [Sulfurimonas sp.]MDD2651740.1 hypothetical protein [Sulfurimonas sp.]MDD3451708.1 hypothetical protein [Sulfurimonas sp.]MDD3451725.1 hypothetical protein [Sulfurimonas sp.]